MRTPRFLLVPALAAALVLAPATAYAETPAPGDTASPTVTVTPDATVTPQETTLPAETPVDQTPAAAPLVELGQGAIPSGKTGAAVDVVVPLFNRGEGKAMQVLVSPKLAVEAANFPFEITQTDYTVLAGDLEAGAGFDVALGSFTLRSGLATGYYAMPLQIQYGDGVTRQVVEKTIFVHVEGVPAPDPDAPDPVTTTPPQTVEIIVSQPPIDMGGGGGGGGYVPPIDTGGSGGGGGGGGGAGSASVPRVMLTSFATNPPEVMAGQAFKLGFTLQNMSGRTGVGNIKVTVSAADASFLPVGGASSVFIAGIGAGQSASRELEFRALPTLEERPYQMTLQIDYEDNSNYQALTGTESIAVVVRQLARAETSTVQAMPSEIFVGQDSNVTFQVQNKGKVRLFNTRVMVKPGQAITGNELFLGNIEAGASGSVDMMVHGAEETSEPITIEISYEDSAGVATTLERQVTITVMNDKGMQGEEMPVEPQPTTATGGLLPLLLGALVLIGAIVGGYLYNRKRKERKEAELAASLAELDAEPIVPVDPQ